jgi:hypothetical protein
VSFVVTGSKTPETSLLYPGKFRVETTEISNINVCVCMLLMVLVLKQLRYNIFREIVVYECVMKTWTDFRGRLRFICVILRNTTEAYE